MVSGNFTLKLWFTFWGPGHSICRAQVNTTLGFPRIDLSRGFLLRCSEPWGDKNDQSAQLQIQLIGFEPNLCHFSFLEPPHKKHVLRTFWGLSGGGRSRFYKEWCTRVSLQNAMHDKSHPETRTSRIQSALCG